MAAGLTRAATTADIPAVTALINRAYDLVERSFVRGDRVTESEVARMLAAPESTILLLEPEEAGRPVLVGAVCYRDEEHGGYFGPLAVDPAYQGQGAGQRLVAAVEAHCAARGHRRLDLTVLSVRPELLAYYRRLGFSEVGTEPYPEPDIFRVPVHLIRMSKTLTMESPCGSASVAPPS